MGTEVTLFDYGALAAEVATELRGTAERVRARFKRATSDIIENGRDLLKVKDRLKHGEFTAWVESELGMSARNAQTMMRAAEVAAEESENFSLLQPSVALKLAAPSVPAEVRTAFVERAAKGERVPIAAVDKELERLRDEREQAALDARATPQALAAEKRAKAKEKEMWDRHRADEEARKERRDGVARRIADILRGRLVEAEWDEVMRLLSTPDSPYGKLISDFMNRRYYDDPDHPEYRPPAHRGQANALTPDDRLGFHEQRPDPTAPFEPPASLRVKIPQQLA